MLRFLSIYLLVFGIILSTTAQKGGLTTCGFTWDSFTGFTSSTPTDLSNNRFRGTGNSSVFGTPDFFEFGLDGWVTYVVNPAGYGSYSAQSSYTITLVSTQIEACSKEDIPEITPTTENITELRWYESNPDGISPPLIPIHIGASFDPDATRRLSIGTHYFYVTGVDLNGQETPSQEIKIIVHSYPTVSITLSTYIICEGSSVTLYASSSQGNVSYQWYKDEVLILGATSSYYAVTQAGEYTARATNVVTGCVGKERRTIRVTSNEPVIFLNKIANTSTCGNARVRITHSTPCCPTTFQLQRKNSNGTWSIVGSASTYTTYLDMNVSVSGTYRVVRL